MPRVPLSPGPGIADQPLPSSYQRSNVTPDMLGATGVQEQQLGNAVMGAASEALRIHTDLVDQGNALRVDDALNKATEAALRLQHDPKEGFTTQTGYAAVSRESGLPLADEYTQRLQKTVQEIATTDLKNDRQRAMFAMKANNVVTSFRGHAMTWETKEFQQYNLSTRDATVQNAQNALTLNFRDPENVDAQAIRIRSAIMGGIDDSTGKFVPGSAQMRGESAAMAKERADQAISSAHEGAVKSALEQGDVNAAVAYFNKHAKNMVAKDVIAVQGTLQRDYDTRQGQTIGNQAVDAVKERLAPPTDYGRLTNLVMGQESGGRRYGADGALLTSLKGAQGEMQVMPYTAKDPGYGVAPARDKSPEELARVGRDYLAAMVKEYKGDVPKALAAYNAGPGAVNMAVTRAGARPGGDWLTMLPAETQQYVTAISAKFAAGEGAAPRASLNEVHEGIRARLGPNASPQAVKTAIETSTQRFSDAEKETKQRGEEAVTLAMQQLDKNGGKYSELPASTRDTLQRLAPDKVDDLFKYAKRIAIGDDTSNPAVYQNLSDQAKLLKLSEGQFFAMKGELSIEDFKHFANERNKLKNPTSISNGPGDLNSSAIKTALDQTLREMKIDPTPKDDGGNDAAHIGAVRKFVDTQVLAAQRDAGKKFTDAETVAFINKLNTSAEMKGWFGAYKAPLLAAKAGDIPSDIKDGLKASLKKQGIDDPTDGQLLESFLHYRAQQAKKPVNVSSNGR